MKQVESAPAQNFDSVRQTGPIPEQQAPHLTVLEHVMPDGTRRTVTADQQVTGFGTALDTLSA